MKKLPFVIKNNLFIGQRVYFLEARRHPVDEKCACGGVKVEKYGIKFNCSICLGSGVDRSSEKATTYVVRSLKIKAIESTQTKPIYVTEYDRKHFESDLFFTSKEANEKARKINKGGYEL